MIFSWCCNELFIVGHIIIVTTAIWLAYIHSKTALTAVISLCIFLANLFVLKEIGLFGLCITPTDAFTAGAGIGLGLLQYKWSRQAAIETLYITFACAALMALLAQWHLWFIPVTHDLMQAHYVAILSPAPRLIIASLISYACCQLVEISMLTFLRRSATFLPFELQGFIAMAIASVVDTIMFSYLGLFGLVSHISHIIIVSYIVKLITAAVGYFLVAILRKIQPR